MATDREFLESVHAQFVAHLGGLTIVPPVVTPPPAVYTPTDSDGCSPLAIVEALVAAEGPSIIMANDPSGAPRGPAPIPRKFQTEESVGRMPEGEAKVIATLSLNASEQHQNRVVRYIKTPAWKFWERGYIEDETVPNALSSKKGAAWLGQAVVGRARLMKQDRAQPHFLMLQQADFEAGAP